MTDFKAYSKTALYVKIAEDRCKEYLKIKNDYSRLFYSILDNHYSTIIFSALAIESFINEIAIFNISKSYFKNYLDKLPIKSKWVIITKLINGSEIDRGGEAFSLLSQLFQARDDLVHHKSSIIDDSNKNEIYEDKLISPEKAILTLRKLNQFIVENFDATKVKYFPLVIDPNFELD